MKLLQHIRLVIRGRYEIHTSEERLEEFEVIKTTIRKTTLLFKDPKKYKHLKS